MEIHDIYWPVAENREFIDRILKILNSELNLSYELNSNKIYYDDNKVITLKNTLYSDGFGYESSRYVDNYENLTALTLNHNFAYTYMRYRQYRVNLLKQKSENI